MARQLSILGCRGVPARHGGFETFAQQLSIYLERRGWDVTVYCQAEEAGSGAIQSDSWNGVRRVIIPVRSKRPSIASIGFDWRALWHACRSSGPLLILGYNTGLFAFLPRLLGRTVIINMDGIEWKRSKWSPTVRAWFWLNEKFAVRAGTMLIADHPEIAAHLIDVAYAPQHKVVMIPYGADRVQDAPVEPLAALGLKPDDYYVSVCRIEPENSVLEIIEAFKASNSTRKLVVLGKLDPDNEYHQAIRDAADNRIVMPGAIYDPECMAALRKHARAYCHGHTVGGTNPSLVEALAVGSAVLAHDNVFNRWTAGYGQFFFRDREACAAQFRRMDRSEAAVNAAREAARVRYAGAFELDRLLGRYENLITGLEKSRQTGAVPEVLTASNGGVGVVMPL